MPPPNIQGALTGPQWVKNLIACSGSGCCRGTGSIPGPAKCLKGSSVAAAAAWIQSLARKVPSAAGAAIIKKTKTPHSAPSALLPSETPSSPPRLGSHLLLAPPNLPPWQPEGGSQEKNPMMRFLSLKLLLSPWTQGHAASLNPWERPTRESLSPLYRK